MKTQLPFWLLLVAVLATAGGANAQIQFTQTLHDFGEIAEGQQVTHTFSFRNTSQQPIKLRKVQASCGCTTPRYTTDEVAPGATGDIEVTFNSQGRPGDFSKAVTVEYGAETNTPIVLTIKGMVRPGPANAQIQTASAPPAPAPLPPTQIRYADTLGGLAFERIRQLATDGLKTDRETEFTFRVRNISQQTIQFNMPIQVPNYMRATSALTALNPGQETVIKCVWIGLKARADGTLTHQQPLNITIGLNTNDPVQPRKELSIIGTFERVYTQEEINNSPRITFTRTEFHGGNVIQGEAMVYKFEFRNTGNQPLTISNVRASCGCTASAPDDSIVAPGATSYVTARFDSRGKMGEQHKTITVVSNDPTQPNLVLHLKCNVIPDPFGGNPGGAPTPGAPAPGGTAPFGGAPMGVAPRQ